MFNKNFLNEVVVALLLVSAVLLGACGPSNGGDARDGQPNVIVIFADDLGYGDLGAFGHPTIRTPYLDRLAREGQRWTNFYAADSVCSPSRAGLLTGRLPIRNGVGPDHPDRRVFFPNSTGGLPPSEITIAEVLKEKGYRTAAVGKWHLGHLPEFLPMNQGFDSYYGIPYSNDMNAVGGWQVDTFFKDPNIEYWDVPLMRGEETLERPANQHTITRRYTEEAVRFIRESKDEPFFLYLAHSLPHVPLFASDEFLGRSARGLYGDVVEEIDDGVGRILSTLEELGLDRNTLVVFTSDNGPWLLFREQGGSAGPLRDGKGSTWEGGMREPTIFWWPGKVKPGVVTGLGSTLDLLPTIASLAGASVPTDRVLDGFDLTPVLTELAESPRQVMFYYRLQDLYAVRKGAFKAHFITETAFAEDTNRVVRDKPLLFNLDHDPGESYNVAGAHPDVIADIVGAVEEHKATIKPVELQLNKYPGETAGGETDLDRPWK